MGRKKKPPKIYISKKKANSTSLAGKLRKEQNKVLDSLAESVVGTIRNLINNPSIQLAVYSIEQTAAVLGIDPKTFLELTKNSIIPPGEPSPSGSMYFRQIHIKVLTMAKERYIYVDESGSKRINRQQMKSFLWKYWPKEEERDERKDKWGSRGSRYNS